MAQTDSAGVNDILTKLKKLEDLKAKDKSINPLKAITDTSYSKIMRGETSAPLPAIGEKTMTTANTTNPIKEQKVQSVLEVDTNVLQAVIQFDELTYNLGSVDQGKIVKQKFTFTNTGTDDLELINVVPDCSCTSPEWSEGKIKPGEKGYVIVTYDTKEDMGKFLKTITVLHNSGEGWSFIEIHGYVAPKL